ncbi:SidJ-related pseudokinase [Solidesulfovibrio alcoholivorans]|uniref:SidJ-related pseudokinase n=1 Tax=Solidesulfovibrio alcoholivorans TaxID=81406 RepID=UPI00049506AE|nr:SidJ-related pseudokinase [Solidesulfovibrio alcoholivorans]
MTGPGFEAFGLDGDFTAAYLAARRVADMAARDPASVSLAAVDALAGLLSRNDHARQTQARILYRDAAGVLVALLAHGPAPLAAASRDALCKALAVPGKPRLATAEAVGALPLPGVRGPQSPEATAEAAPATFAMLLGRAGAAPDAPPRVAGRSLLVPGRAPGELVVIKRLRRGEDPRGLALEAAWMEHCAGLPFPAPCHVPTPCRDGAARLFAVADAPHALPGLDPEGRCLAYRATTDYFRYPNEPGRPLDGEALVAVMARAALLLGWLAGRGIVHEAAIPLFHNRVQRERRDDGGVYDWRLPGRLDRWLYSAAHPNFGASGLRDFEHLAAVSPGTTGGGRLYRRMGDHVVSLLLVAGSAFRMRDPALVGRDGKGHPVDARHLFDPPLLSRIVAAVFAGYHEGFVGAPPAVMPLCPEALARRMVEEMGVDRHMTELLRVADQEGMTDAAFAAFLTSRGLSPAAAARHRRGEADVALETGPHLGDFNNRTSLPELSEAAAAMVAACLAARHERDRGGGGEEGGEKRKMPPAARRG